MSHFIKMCMGNDFSTVFVHYYIAYIIQMYMYSSDVETRTKCPAHGWNMYGISPYLSNSCIYEIYYIVFHFITDVRHEGWRIHVPVPTCTCCYMYVYLVCTYYTRVLENGRIWPWNIKVLKLMWLEYSIKYYMGGIVDLQLCVGQRQYLNS